MICSLDSQNKKRTCLREKKLGRYILGGDVLILVPLNYNIENADNISQQILVVRVLALI